MSNHEKVLDGNPIDPSSLDEAVSRVSDFEDLDLVSNDPLIKFVECLRHKKAHKTKKVNHKKYLGSKNPLRRTIFSKNVSRVSMRNIPKMGSKKGSCKGPTQPIQEEVSSDIHKRNSNFIKEARENMKMSARLGVKFHGRESYNIKKFLELKGVEMSEQDIIAEIKALDFLEGDASISAEL